MTDEFLLVDARTDLRRRWATVEDRFSDDPVAAIWAADELIEHAITQLRQLLDRRRVSVRRECDALDDATAEQLRAVLQRYAALLIHVTDASAPAIQQSELRVATTKQRTRRQRGVPLQG